MSESEYRTRLCYACGRSFFENAPRDTTSKRYCSSACQDQEYLDPTRPDLFWQSEADRAEARAARWQRIQALREEEQADFRGEKNANA